jgi:pimeloyl-ACP methyl ester carboxylesterase
VSPVRDFRVGVTGGVSLAGEDRGDLDAPVVVLLHGLSSTRRWWDFVADRLVDRHRVIRFDHCGHGESSIVDSLSGVDSVDSVDGLARHTVELLDQLAVRPAVLAGHSLGGAVALAVAANRPDLAGTVAAVDGGLYDPRLMFGPTWARARSVMLPGRRGRITLDVLRAWLAGTDLPGAALPIVAANYRADGTGGLRPRLDPAQQEELAHSLWRQSPVELLAAVRSPVLALAAYQHDERQDEPRRESLRQAHGPLGDRLHVSWVSGGHDLPLTAPEPVAEALADLSARAAMAH